MKLHKLLIFVLTLTMSTYVLAQLTQVPEPMVFENQQQEDRFNQLTLELRCLVCQNQNLAENRGQQRWIWRFGGYRHTSI